MRRIVVMRPGALGDALLAVPALAALRARWPAAHLTVIARADVLPLLASSDLADTTYAFDLPAWSGLWADAPPTHPLIAETLAGADALVAWLGDADGTLRRNAAALGVAQVIVAPGRPAEDAREHAAVYLLRTLAPLGLHATTPTPDDLVGHLPMLHPSPAASAAAARRWNALGLAGRAVVALHPGSGGASKCWPAGSFAALADVLVARGVSPLIIKGPADEEVERGVLTGAATGDELAVLRDVPVDELAAAMASCTAYVGNDSGVTHLAALLRIPTLALFGPTDPARWSPVGRHVHMLRADEGGPAPMSALTVQRVVRALEEVLLPRDP